MKHISVFLILLAFAAGLACNPEQHFISDRQYRKKVQEQFKKQVQLANHRNDTLFGVFRDHLTTEEHEALEFLYAYMSLNDLADYDGRFFLKNVRSSLAARDTFTWGREIPEEIFRHFVLPVRINNENLDSSRWVFFAELKDRIKGLPMKEAALEVNHWCHEKVTYRATDSRTSSPLATVKTAFGRCGEESTFTAAALRAVGIPARQCYTPRWAHCDDNHAWVEVWIDSAWHYLGACEPEPDLDMAWFTEPVKRAMLVNTNVFGDYRGPEDILVKEERYTRINVLPNYTQTKRIWARVLDVHQQPIPTADVEFQLYNYAEFYPLHKTTTDAKGLASLLTGYGDLMIWATKNGKFGFAKADVRQMDTVNVYLELTSDITGGINFDMTPPVKQDIPKQVDDSRQKKNHERLTFEDYLRTSYEETFIDSSKTTRLAHTLPVDPVQLWRFLKGSRGNWRAIVAFVSGVPEPLKENVFPLLEVISEKDLRDIDPVVLLDAIASPQSSVRNLLSEDTSHESRVTGTDLFVPYVMNPRVDNEWLKPFHTYLRKQFPAGFIQDARENPEILVNWIKSTIAIDKHANYSRAAITPVGVYDLKVTDPHSRDIFFVAICRSFSIPARLEPASKLPQYYQEGEWKDIYFERPPTEAERNVSFILTNDPGNPVMPEYAIHYTIGQYKDGFFRTLDYENSELVEKLPATLGLVPGTYLVVSGNRLPDGTVLSRLALIRLDANTTTGIPVTLRKDYTPPPVFGSFLREKLKNDLRSAGISVNPSTGLILAWLEPGKEPTRHFVASLKQKSEEMGHWNGAIILFFPTREDLEKFKANEKEGLPANVTYTLFSAYPFDLLYHSLDMPLSGQYPVVIYMNPQGVINFFSQGYRIGTGEELVKCIRRRYGR